MTRESKKKTDRVTNCETVKSFQSPKSEYVDDEARPSVSHSMKLLNCDIETIRDLVSELEAHISPILMPYDDEPAPVPDNKRDQSCPLAHRLSDMSDDLFLIRHRLRRMINQINID